MATSQVYSAIPHREPFLFVDEVIEIREEGAKAKRKIRPEEEFFKGHYPGNPIMPGVLLCEAVFQTAAIFLAGKLEAQKDKHKEMVPVLSRIGEGKFKQMVKPGDEILIDVQLTEVLGGFYFMKGKIQKDGKAVMSVDFTLTLVEKV